jgi:hypothetical protein
MALKLLNPSTSLRLTGQMPLDLEDGTCLYALSSFAQLTLGYGGRTGTGTTRSVANF